MGATDRRSCEGCSLAVWQRTTNGRLHPSGDGKCLWAIPKVSLPNSRYYISGEPNPCGGRIKRGHVYAQECAQYVKREEITR